MGTGATATGIPVTETATAATGTGAVTGGMPATAMGIGAIGMGRAVTGTAMPAAVGVAIGMAATARREPSQGRGRADGRCGARLSMA